MASEDLKRRLLWAAGLFIFFLPVYALSRNHSYPFDGLLFAGVIEAPLLRMPADQIFEWNHFLWYPTGRLFYLVLRLFHVPLRGYESLQLLNAFAGAGGVAALFLTLSRLASRPWAAAWSLASGFSAIYWARSAGAENYHLGVFWGICFACALLSYWLKPSDRYAAFMAVCAVLSAYYHLGNLAFLGAAFLGILIRQAHGVIIRHGTVAGGLMAVLWIPYAMIHHWFEPGGFSRWWSWSRGLAEGYSPFLNPTGAFDWTFLKNVPTTAQTFMKSILWFESINAGTMVRLAGLAVLGTSAVLYRRWKSADANQDQELRRRLGYIFLIPLAGITALYAIWQPWQPFYWAIHTALLCLFLGAVSFRGAPVHRFSLEWVLLGVMVGFLAVHNLGAIILPEKISPRQFIVDACLKIGEITPAQSPIIISGRSDWGFLKPYLPYFARRDSLAVDLFVVSAVQQSREPIAWMQMAIASHLAYGIPVYLMEDTLQQKNTFSDFRLSPEQIESIWKPYSLLPVSEFPGNPPNRLYLLWSNSLPKPIQAAIGVRLKTHGLLDQMLAVYKERSRLDKSKELAGDIANLEATLRAQTPAKGK